MPTFLDRYLRGEHQQVWADLVELDGEVWHEPLMSDALAVTYETMKRVRKNIELLIIRLNDMGFKFGTYPDGINKVDGYKGPLNPPSRDISRRIEKFSSLLGIRNFPLSIKMFWEIVGDVDFTGYHPLWPPLSDPLIVFPIESIEADYPRWLYQVEAGDVEAGLYGVPLSPDFYHKNNMSGGEPYRIRVPNFGIDGTLENERHETTLVNYLRICFRFGGFPGFEWHEGIISKEILSLNNGLMPM